MLGLLADNANYLGSKLVNTGRLVQVACRQLHSVILVSCFIPKFIYQITVAINLFKSIREIKRNNIG